MTKGSKKRKKKFFGVYKVMGKKSVSFGIDYIHPQTGERVRKILKGCKSESEAFDIRGIELADAERGLIHTAYGMKTKGTPVLFEDMVDTYLKYHSMENKDYRTDKQRASILKNAFSGKLMSDINPFMIEKFKRTMVKTKARTTVNKYLSLGSQVFQKAVEWEKYKGENPFQKVSRFKIKKIKKLLTRI